MKHIITSILSQPAVLGSAFLAGIALLAGCTTSNRTARLDSPSEVEASQAETVNTNTEITEVQDKTENCEVGSPNANLSACQRQRMKEYNNNFKGDKVIYNSYTKSLELMRNDAEITYQLIDPENSESKGIWKYYYSTNKHKPLVVTSHDESIVAEMSPDGKRIFYNTALKDENYNIIKENPIRLLNIDTGIEEELFEIPLDRTFAGVQLWDGNKIYYVLRSNIEDLHFPDPESTDFYVYDLDNKSNKHIAKATDFTTAESKSGHILLIGKSEDNKYLYFTNTGHGDPGLFGVWKLDQDTFEIGKVFDAEEEGLNFPYILSYISDKEKILAYDTSVDGNEKFMFTIDLVNNKIKYYKGDEYEVDRGQTIVKDSNLIIKTRNVHNNDNKSHFTIYDLSTLRFKEEFDINIYPNSISEYDQDNKIILGVSLYDYPSGLVELNLVTKEIKEISKFTMDMDGIRELHILNQ